MSSVAAAAFEALAKSYKQYEVYAEQKRKGIVAQKTLVALHQKDQQSFALKLQEMEERQNALSKGPVIDDNFNADYLRIQNDKDALERLQKEMQALQKMEKRAMEARIQACDDITYEFSRKMALLRIPVVKALQDAITGLCKGNQVWAIDSEVKDGWMVTRFELVEVVHVVFRLHKTNGGDIRVESKENASECLHWTGVLSDVWCPQDGLAKMENPLSTLPFLPFLQGVDLQVQQDAFRALSPSSLLHFF